VQIQEFVKLPPRRFLGKPVAILRFQESLAKLSVFGLEMIPPVTATERSDSSAGTLHPPRVKVTRFSCQVRLALSLLAYNLGNLWRRLGLPRGIKNWSLTSLQQRLVKTGARLVKTGARLVKHARYYWLLLAEGHLTRRRFGAMLGRIACSRCRPDRELVDQVSSGIRRQRVGEKERCRKSGGISGNFGGGADLRPWGGAVYMKIVSHCRGTAGWVYDQYRF
jgi:hypothetical protein